MLTLSQAGLYRVIKGVLAFASTDETRPHLCGVQLESDGKTLLAVATNGHCLAAASTPCAGPVGSMLATLATVKAAEKALRFKRGEDHAEVTIDLATGLIEVGLLRVALRPSAEKFVPWQRVVPVHAAAGATFGVDPKYLATAAQNAAAFAGKDAAVKLTPPEDALSPVRVDAHHYDSGGSLTIVVMPMRLDDAVNGAVDGEGAITRARKVA